MLRERGVLSAGSSLGEPMIRGLNVLKDSVQTSKSQGYRCEMVFLMEIEAMR